MTDDPASRLSALLEQEKHLADRELDKALNRLWDDFIGKNTFQSSRNPILTARCFEENLEARLASASSLAERVLPSTGPQQARETKEAIKRVAVDWLGAQVDACQQRLLAHVEKLKMPASKKFDLGRDRLLATLSANLALAGSAGPAPVATGEYFVDPTRLDDISGVASDEFDVKRLVLLCEELNACFQHGCFNAVAFLTRAVLDHIPPLFGCTTFSEVANNYPGGRSFKQVAIHLELASRKISDALLHTPIRSSESLPSVVQVDVRQPLDVVLAEAVRINRGA